jgi:GT2 family glycosyltransferase
LGGVALVPRHPRTNACEWPFARARTDACPVFGCGNLVRASAWRAVGGYEAAFFLYRNDADLALKLLGVGMGVLMEPSWTVWHDSPAAQRKGERWLRLATRNWVWMCRRHAPIGATRVIAIIAGVLTALRHAGPAPARLWRVVRGVADGLANAHPPVPGSVRADGSALRALLRMRWKGRADG